MWITIGDAYEADVHDAAGNVPPKTKFGFYHDPHINVGRVLGDRADGRYLNGSGLFSILKANQSHIGVVDISRLYNFEEPGTYTIVLRDSAFQTVMSNPITVTVLPTPSAASASPREQTPGATPFSLDISTDASVRRGSAVDIYVVTKNLSTHSIVLRRQENPRDVGMLGSVFRVDISNSAGNSPADTELGQSTNHLGDTPPDPALTAAARAAGTLVSLNPGQDWRNTLRVSDLYDLSKPGQYTIQVRRWDDETKTWVKSNTITITVTP